MCHSLLFYSWDSFPVPWQQVRFINLSSLITFFILFVYIFDRELKTVNIAIVLEHLSQDKQHVTIFSADHGTLEWTQKVIVDGIPHESNVAGPRRAEVSR